MFQLLNYANAHEGWFPRGEATPEASLSLLARMIPGDSFAEILQGKSVDLSVVRARLRRGDLLDPETCGWHYVEGLRKSDNPDLALFWDKAGLGHNGQRLPDRGHIVWFVGFKHEYIPESQWPDFLTKQDQLLAEVRAKRPVSKATGDGQKPPFLSTP